MELHEALAQISEIRRQVAQSQTFRGYRSATVGVSAVLAVLGAAVQSIWIPAPVDQMPAFLSLWIAIAVISLVVTGVEMFAHCRRSASRLTTEMTCLAVQQFLPCIVAGGLLTYVLYLFAEESLWMLPGLWAVLFSLGVFASYRLLPKPSLMVAIYYLATGIGCLVFARGDAAFSPWAMVVTFGMGQLLTAGILYWTLERRCESIR